MGYNKSLRHSNGNTGTSKQSPAGKTRSSGSAIQWANVTLTPQQKEVLRQTEFDGARALDTLAHFIETGHKLVLSPKNDRGFVSATLLGHTSECPNAGAGLSGEGGSTERAILSLLFKLDILDGVFSVSIESPDDDFR